MEETVRGLLRPRPLFYEGQVPDNFLGYRDFVSMDDVRSAETHLASTEFLAEYFDRYLSLPPDAIKTRCLTGGMGDTLDQVRWSHVLASVWVRSLLENTYAFQVLSSEEVRHFIRMLKPPARAKQTRPISTSTQEAFLHWLEAQGPTDKVLPRESLRELFLKAVHDVGEELLALDPRRPVDARFIRSLCVSSDR